MLQYLDAVFILMWRYRFSINLPDILRRDENLQTKYLEAQENLHQNMMVLMQSFRDSGLLDLKKRNTEFDQYLEIGGIELDLLPNHSAPGAKVTKAVVYQGVLVC